MKVIQQEESKRIYHTSIRPETSVCMCNREFINCFTLTVSVNVLRTTGLRCNKFTRTLKESCTIDFWFLSLVHLTRVDIKGLINKFGLEILRPYVSA